MIKVWSDVPGGRRKELVADIATILWVAFWSNIVWQLFEFLSSFAEAGRRLGIPANTVSRRIQELEEQLGARLMPRDALALERAG